MPRNIVIYCDGTSNELDGNRTIALRLRDVGASGTSQLMRIRSNQRGSKRYPAAELPRLVHRSAGGVQLIPAAGSYLPRWKGVLALRRHHHHPVSSLIAVTALSAVAMPLSGCSTPRGYVAKEWSLSMREMAVNPLFPPREDVQVGDMHLYPVLPGQEDEVLDERGFLPLSIWIASADLGDAGKTNDDVVRFYATRFDFPKTPSAVLSGTDLKDPTGQTETAADDAPAGAPSAPPGSAGPSTTTTLAPGVDEVTSDATTASGILTPPRLRRVGFPSFMSATLTQGDLSAVIPAEAVSLAFGASFSDSKVATISIPVAESYGLPAAEVLRNFFVYDPTPDKPAVVFTNRFGRFDPFDLNYIVPHNLMQPVNRNAQSGVPGQVRVYVTLVTEVYYTRAIDVSIQHSSAAGGKIMAKVADTPVPVPSSASAGGAGGSATGDTTAPSSTTEPPTTTTSTAPSSDIVLTTPTPTENAARLNAELDKVQFGNQLGGSLRFLTASQTAIGMRRVFDRPVAIGYRGLLLTYTGTLIDDDYVQKNSGSKFKHLANKGLYQFEFSRGEILNTTIPTVQLGSAQ